MNVEVLGMIDNVVNKSGTFCDNSSSFETKSFDTGSGNCGAQD